MLLQIARCCFAFLNSLRRSVDRFPRLLPASSSSRDEQSTQLVSLVRNTSGSTHELDGGSFRRVGCLDRLSHLNGPHVLSQSDSSRFVRELCKTNCLFLLRPSNRYSRSDDVRVLFSFPFMVVLLPARQEEKASSATIRFASDLSLTMQSVAFLLVAPHKKEKKREREKVSKNVNIPIGFGYA